MSRRGRMRKLRSVVVVRNKEIVDAVSLAVTGTTVTTATIAAAVNDYVGTVGTCPLGATIKGFEIELSDIGSTGDARRDWYLWKSQGTVSSAGPTPGATGGSPFRRLIIHEEKGLGANDGIGNPLKRTVHINIPKRYWRMAEDDEWQIRYGTSLGAGDTYDLCIKAIYKWVM